VKSFVSLSDIHYPYEDPKAMELVRQFLKDFQPDEVVLNGDIFDCPTISKYSPRRAELVKEISLQEQLDHGTEKLEELRDCAPHAEWHFVEGNHEDRFQAYLGSKARELASLNCLDFDKLAKLDELKMSHTRYGEGIALNDRLFVYHGQYVGANWTDKERSQAGCSTITGHQHQQRVTYHRDRSRSYKNVGQGCLCSMNPPYLRTPPNWQQGFVYGYIIDEDKFRVIETEIVRGEHEVWMAPDGEVYRVPLVSTFRGRKSKAAPRRSLAA
jgi:predicted phosphodiesterase